MFPFLVLKYSIFILKNKSNVSQIKTHSAGNNNGSFRIEDENQGNSYVYVSHKQLYVSIFNWFYQPSLLFKNVNILLTELFPCVPCFVLHCEQSKKSNMSNFMSIFCNRLSGYIVRGHCLHCWLSCCVNVDTVISNFTPSASSSCGTMCHSGNIDLYKYGEKRKKKNAFATPSRIKYFHQTSLIQLLSKKCQIFVQIKALTRIVIVWRILGMRVVWLWFVGMETWSNSEITITPMNANTTLYIIPI